MHFSGALSVLEVNFRLMDLNKVWQVRDFCVHTHEGEGLVVLGTERQARIFEVRTCTYA